MVLKLQRQSYVAQELFWLHEYKDAADVQTHIRENSVHVLTLLDRFRCR